jgi:hypothetical protein
VTRYADCIGDARLHYCQEKPRQARPRTSRETEVVSGRACSQEQPGAFIYRSYREGREGPAPDDTHQAREHIPDPGLASLPLSQFAGGSITCRSVHFGTEHFCVTSPRILRVAMPVSGLILTRFVICADLFEKSSFALGHGCKPTNALPVPRPPACSPSFHGLRPNGVHFEVLSRGAQFKL